MKAISILIMISLLLLGCGRKPETLFLYDIGGNLFLATSEMKKPSSSFELGPYGAHNLFDKNSSTAWVEGTEDEGKGQSVYLAIKEGVKNINIVNGYARSKDIFEKNNRVKVLRLSLYLGIERSGHATETQVLFDIYKYNEERNLLLKDTMDVQKIPFPFDWNKLKLFKDEIKKAKGSDKGSQAPDSINTRYILRFQIKDIYKGAQYNDTCLSDIFFDVEGEIKDIYANEKQDAVIIETMQGEKIVLEQDPSSVFQIIETSPDKQWVIVIRMDADAGAQGRSETEYRLYHAGLQKMIDPEVIGHKAGNLYGFKKEGDDIFLLYMNSQSSEDEKVNVKEIMNRIE
ncbi:MAG: hypothetical protein JW827_03320 [Spirochaetes bacterium]|nr:hypothetical protein [Spirochaetota bacterium]